MRKFLIQLQLQLLHSGTTGRTAFRLRLESLLQNFKHSSLESISNQAYFAFSLLLIVLEADVRYLVRYARLLLFEPLLSSVRGQIKRNTYLARRLSGLIKRHLHAEAAS